MDRITLFDKNGEPFSTAPTIRQEALAPGGEVEQLIYEATRQVEDELRLEDAGWINFAQRGGDVVFPQDRINNLKLSRLYYTKDPLGRQAIRLWTDYTFGPGMTWSVPEENEQAKKVLVAFWNSKANQAVLSARGQRKSSDKLLVDGEIFFALFLGAKGEAKIRRIDPLEISEIITDPDDIEDVRFYRRVWVNSVGVSKTTIYRSTTNMKGEATPDAAGSSVVHNDDALVYHLTYNTISQRGNPLLLPALDWIKQYRRFLASRVAIMLAIARFAWKRKVKGGPVATEAIKGVTHGKEVAAGSDLIENYGVETTPIKSETGAKNAYDDARMIKLQIAAAVGIPEQYFGDISIGNLATAKTVELPMMKMFQSYQKVWEDTYKDINEVVLEKAGVPADKWYVDMDFPAIAPADVAMIAQSLLSILTVMPEFALSPDVQQVALLALGVNDPAEVLDALSKEAKANPEAALLKAFQRLKESMQDGHRPVIIK